MDKFADIEAFVSVVDTGSFSAAAERLESAKSAVSRRVSALEERLGVKLLNRTTRRLNLTDNGRDFYERAVRILADLTEAEEAISDADCQLRGRIRVAAPLTFGLRHLAPAINRFAEQHPQIQFDLDLNDREVNIIDEGFDMAVRIGRLADSSMVARRLCPIRFVTVASPGYLAEHPAPETPDDLSSHLGLRYTNLPRQAAWRYHDRDGKAYTPDVPDRLTANNGEILANAAANGLGVSLQPTFIAYEYLTANSLQRLLPDFEPGALNAYAVFPPGRYLSRRVRAFADFLAGYFGDEPYWDSCLQGRTGS